uniref:ABC transporter permease n=1 Tax=Roseivirga sp. TaxID=1964215 RepID=UPI00404799A3
MRSYDDNAPSKFWLKFFRWFCRAEYQEDIEGDLLERFDLRVEKQGAKIAKKLFVKDVLRLFRPSMIKKIEGNQQLNYYGMFKHNLKITFRSYLKHKSAFLINLIGLSSGLACTLFIYLWVNDERSVDKFHKLDDQLFQVLTMHEESGAINTQEDTQAILAQALEAEIPEIEIVIQATPSFWFGKMPLSTEEKTIKTEGRFASEKYFEVFSFPLLYGNPSEVLKDKSRIVLSKSLATSLFGSPESAMGRTLNWQLLQFGQDFQVSGVFEDVPHNSTEDFQFVLPFKVFAEILGNGAQWGNYNALTYAVVTKGANVDLLNQKIAGFVKEKNPGSNVSPYLRPYSDKYLFSNYENGVQAGGRIEYVNLFSIISIFILLIACINFMNLSTAKASRRVKEVGVKKAIGAERKSLVAQYLQESFLMTLIAILVALALVVALLPQFNIITGKEISIHLSSELLTSLLIILVGTGVVAGSYPALYLSAFKATTILKGHIKSSLGELWARKGLVVFQFTLSVILIVSVIIVSKQIEYVQSKNLGYSKENLILFANEGQLTEKLDVFIDQLQNSPGIINAGATSHTIISGGSYTTGVHWPTENPDVSTRFGNMTVSYDFIETLGVEIIAGRSFSRDFTTDISKIILNEKAIETIGYQDPIGKTINLWGNDMQIIGVVKDFNFASLHEIITPMFFKLDDKFLTNILVRIEPGQERAAIERIESIYKEYNPDFEFNYSFLDQDYAQQYAAEGRISILSKYFGGIAIIISCLGLFGLAAFTAERRFKEIGIRKALGASSLSIIRLLSSDFNKMIAVAIVIAIPISYYFMLTWLEGFAYKIDLKAWYFISAGLVALFIAWFTVAMQTYKAAKINPSQSLRSE